MEESEKEARNKAKELADKVSEPQKKPRQSTPTFSKNVYLEQPGGSQPRAAADESSVRNGAIPMKLNALFVIMLREEKIDADMVLVGHALGDAGFVGSRISVSFSRIVTRLNFKSTAPCSPTPPDTAAPFSEVPWYERGWMGLAIKGKQDQEAMIPAGAVDDNVSTAKSTIQVRQGLDARRRRGS